MLHDDARLRCPERARRNDEIALLQRQHLTAHEARHGRPRDHADGEHHHHRRRNEGQVAPDQDLAQQQDEEKVREREHDVGEPHHQVVGEPSAERGQRAEREAERQHDHLRAHADLDRKADALERARPQVATQLVRPEPVVGSRPQLLVRRDIGRRVTLDSVDIRGREGDHRHDNEDREPDHRQAVAQEAAPRVGPQAAVIAREGLVLVAEQWTYRGFLRCHQRYLIRGSTTAYIKSTMRLMTATVKA